jgi:putative ABC transport system permease protein
MAYSIRQTGEIGVRMALGASATDILRMVLIEGFYLLAAGVLVGTAAAIVLARSMVGLIYGLAAWNSLTFVAVTVVLNVVALLTILVSARQATLVKPTVALRHT